MTERFELLEQVGRGGMGAVWKARDTETGQAVALKIPWEQFAAEPQFVERLEREVELTRRIDSPYVSRTLGVGRRDGRPFIVMEFVEGKSLKELVALRGRLGWDEARPILRQVALGLDAAHRAGIVHRDVKPSNVIVGPDGTPRLVDFGVARAEDMTAITGSRTTFGTPAYSAPEGTPSPQADLYGLGCIAFELLSGRQVFLGDSEQQVMLRHIRDDPDLSLIPAETRSIVGWLLRKRPADRPNSAGQVAAILDGTSTMPRGLRLRRRRGKRKAALAFTGVMAIAGIAATVPFLLIGGDGGGDAAGSRVVATFITAEEHWQASVSVENGDTVQVAASGTWHLDVEKGLAGSAACGEVIAEDGWDGQGEARFAAPGLPIWCLVGRIGEDGEPFTVSSDYEGTAETGGMLYLALNDDILTDNNGGVSVTITVTSPE